ncbi:hypothetical protein [Stenotrophomonas maltophilia]|uniref:hypothetical protein n=1 Tax=Stenotrophomonas maltophilia TaxID=40324 RepID=UPI0012FD7AF5|nr:hypothetical protein [Stenotrophomonas maltophilia]
MKSKLIFTSITIALLAGCASMPEGSSIDKMRTAKAAGLSCLAAGAATKIFGGDKKEALTVCAVAGVTGGIASYRAQLNEARELEAAAKAAGLAAQVQTKQVTEQGKQVEVLQSLTIKYSPEDLKAMNAETVQVFDKVARLSTKASNELTFTVTGKDKATCLIPISELVKRNAVGNHKVNNQCGAGDYQLVITPIPDIK